MKVEMIRLQEENQELLSEQFIRETEIRVEVAQEMAQRSAHLLDQLQDIQARLDGKESTVKNITKSCRKVYRRQFDKANEETARDLEEAEEELERLKITYEIELNQLREEKEILVSQLDCWRAKAKTLENDKKTYSSVSFSNFSPSSGLKEDLKTGITGKTFFPEVNDSLTANLSSTSFALREACTTSLSTNACLS
jgi:uncharacterized protein (DUF342 family)